MISKAEYFYAKKKKDDLKITIAGFEATSDVYKMWRKWLSLTEKEKFDLITKWNEYYQKCKESYYGEKFWEASKYYDEWLRTQNGEFKIKFIQVVEQVKNSNIAFIKTPSTVNPQELEQRLHNYFELKKKQQEYQNIFDEYEEVYEPRKTKTSDSL